MPVYNFKQIGPVPSAPDLIDIVLMRTQRKTPTVIHPGYKITRIRAFYIRKIKFTQQTIHERLGNILSEFPRLNDIHPFYSDLCNTLYDRDHYKLALGQLHTAKNLVDAIARDMIRMVKYGDSAYRCKCLKRAALGRMCTVLKRQKAALGYLDEVRRHLSRLPALDPHTRTLLLCGLPNVGKSSFLNKITRANVDVQPYAFTTKSLYVGHCDHRYLRWQVIDTPGLLDHSLEERNTIEMQAVTALAHLTCSVLFFVDVSEQCGYPLEQQCSLFKSIRPLFANKEVIIVVNKVDAQPWDTLEESKKQMVQDLTKLQEKVTLMTMSNHSEQGVSEVKAAACDRLLASRVDARVGKVDHVMNRLQVIYPNARDGVTREACIPDSVVTALNQGAYGSKDGKPIRSRVGYAPTNKNKEGADGDPNDTVMDTALTLKKTARDLMWENGGPGVWAPDYREQYDLAEDEWRFDAIPQILNGKNVCDYIDPDISAKLVALELEEEQLQQEQGLADMEQNESDLESDEEVVVTAIRDKQALAKQRRRRESTVNRPVMPRAVRGRRRDKHNVAELNEDKIKETLGEYGIDTARLQERGRKRERSVRRRRSGQDDKDDDKDNNDNDMAVDAAPLTKTQAKKVKRDRPADTSRSRSRSRTPAQRGLRDAEHAKLAQKKDLEGRREWQGRGGEADRRTQVSKIQWCNTGKKRMGTHYQR